MLFDGLWHEECDSSDTLVSSSQCQDIFLYISYWNPQQLRISAGLLKVREVDLDCRWCGPCTNSEEWLFSCKIRGHLIYCCNNTTAMLIVMSTWNCSVWKKCRIHVPGRSEFLNTTNIWLTSLHSTETLTYTFVWLCSLPKYAWRKDYAVVEGDSMKGHTFHTLLRSFLPVHGFMSEFTCLWSTYV